MESENLKDLDVFERIVSLLESGKEQNYYGEGDRVAEQVRMITNGMQMQQIADPMGIYMELVPLKLKCSNLLNRALQLKKDFTFVNGIKQSSIEQRFQGIMIDFVVFHLERLMIFYCHIDPFQITKENGF